MIYELCVRENAIFCLFLSLFLVCVCMGYYFPFSKASSDEFFVTLPCFIVGFFEREEESKRERKKESSQKIWEFQRHHGKKREFSKRIFKNF